jgi:hypothetical protein
MLREYFLFACNIRMRIGEMREIRWRDVTFTQTEAGKQYVRVRAPQRKTLKSKGPTKRIGRSTADRALQVLRETGTDSLVPNDFVLCNANGKQIGEFREGFDTMLKGASSYLPKSEIASNFAISFSMIENYYSDDRGEYFVDKLI